MTLPRANDYAVGIFFNYGDALATAGDNVIVHNGLHIVQEGGLAFVKSVDCVVHVLLDFLRSGGLS